MKQVIIEITTTGEVKIEGKGFKGAECEKATKALEEALGAVKDRKKSPDYYAQTQTVQRA
jgi:hypothetical protein